MVIKRITSLCFAVLYVTMILTGLSSCTKTDEPGWFVSKKAGFAIKYPEDWQVTYNSESWIPVVEAESPPDSDTDEFAEYIAVDVEELPHKITLEEYFKQYRNELAGEGPYFEEHECGEVKIGGEGAMYLVYEKEMPEAFWVVLAYVMVKKDKAYVISCAAENRQFMKHEAKFREVAHTFRFE